MTLFFPAGHVACPQALSVSNVPRLASELAGSASSELSEGRRVLVNHRWPKVVWKNDGQNDEKVCLM